jgi:hypothetical protein
MQIINLDEVRSELNPARKSRRPSHIYQDSLREVSPRSLSKFYNKIILQLEDKGDFYESVKDNKRDAGKIKNIAQKTFDRLYNQAYSNLLNLKFSKEETFENKLTGEPLKWVEENIQLIYQELLNGNPFAIVNSMRIVVECISEMSKGKSVEKSAKREIKRIIELIEPNNEAFSSLDTSDIATIDFFPTLQKIHKIKKPSVQLTKSNIEDILSSNLSRADMENIVRIYAHLINRSDINITGPLITFLGDEDNLPVKSIFLNKILKLDPSSGSDAIETLVSGLLTFKDSGMRRTGVGEDLVSNRASSEWATGEYKKLYEMANDENIATFEMGSGDNIFTISDKKNDDNNFIVSFASKKEAIDYLMRRSKNPNNPEYERFQQWKRNLALPDTKNLNPRGRKVPRDLGRIVKMLSYYYLNEPKPIVIPRNYTSVILEDGEDVLAQKGNQFLNILSFAKQFSNEGVSEIEETLSKFYEEDETTIQFWTRMRDEEPPLYKQIENILQESINKLFTSLPEKIKSLLVEGLSQINVQSGANYIRVNYKGNSFDPNQYLKRLYRR